MSELQNPGAPNPIPAGYAAQSLTGGFPSIVLSDNVAAADILEFTGVLTAQDITVVVPPPVFPQQVTSTSAYFGAPAPGWLKVLKNSTSGPFAVKVTGPGGSALAVPQGQSGVYFTKDGKHVESVQAMSSVQAFAASLVFRPGVPSSGNVFETWTQLMAAFATTRGTVTIAVDDSVAPTIIDVGSWDLQDRATLVDLKQKENPQTTLFIPDGATLRNLTNFAQLLNIEATPITTPSLAYDPGVIVLIIREGVVLANRGTRALIEVAPASSVNILLSDNAFLDNSLPPFAPFANLAVGPGQSFSITSLGNSGLLGLTNTVSGVAGAFVVIQYDSSWQGNPTLPNYFGGLIERSLNDALFMDYEPAVLANWSGIAPTSTANALDRLAAKVGPVP